MEDVEITFQKYLKMMDEYQYPSTFSCIYWIEHFVKSEQFYIREFLRYLRKEKYYTFIKPNKFLKYYYQRKKNIRGSRLGFFIPAGCFDCGLKIYHYGPFNHR